MKKIKGLAIATIFVGSMLCSSDLEARVTGGGTRIEGNCVVTYETHSILFGLITWEEETSRICGDSPIEFDYDDTCCS